MKKLWFKRKRYGWGWTPATWEGWGVLLAYLVIVFANVYRLERIFQDSPEALTYFIPQTFLITFILILICYKTGEKPRWQWGEKE
jgi:hypothetical protein